jgi:hypothetical protein
MALHFLGPSKSPFQASISGGPPSSPPNVGPTYFYFLFYVLFSPNRIGLSLPASRAGAPPLPLSLSARPLPLPPIGAPPRPLPRARGIIHGCAGGSTRSVDGGAGPPRQLSFKKIHRHPRHHPLELPPVGLAVPPPPRARLTGHGGKCVPNLAPVLAGHGGPPPCLILAPAPGRTLAT